MAKKKKSVLQSFVYLALFLLINIIVFNASSIFSFSKQIVGVANLEWERVKKININMDNELGRRAQVFSYKNRIIVNMSDALHIYNLDGVHIAQGEINSNVTNIVGMDNAFVVSDFTQGNMKVLDYTGRIIGDIVGLGEIDDIVAINESMFAVVTKEGALVVYNIQGEEVSNIKLPVGQIIDVTASIEEKLLIVTILSSDEYNYNSKLITFNIKQGSISNGSMIGSNNNLNSIVYKARVFNEHVIVVDNEKTYVYELKDVLIDEVWKYPRKGELVTFEIDNNGNVIQVISIENTEELFGFNEYQLIGLNKDGSLLYDPKLDQKYDKIALGYGKVIIYNKEKLLVYNSDGNLVAERITSNSLLNVSWLSETRILFEYNGLVEIMELSYK